jgi:SAM-dependent methyltransferase
MITLIYMKPALSFRQPTFPTSWRSLPSGDFILDEINSQLAPWWPKFFGYYLLKIGALSGEITVNNCSIKHHVTLIDKKNSDNKNSDENYIDKHTINKTSDAKLNKQTIYAEIDDLPILEHSVDVCLLSHAFEFSLDPHHVIREANRVLIPNGYLVLTGYNPFSLAGLNKLMPYRRHQDPWKERFFSTMRIKDWLQLMGFEILMEKSCLHTTLENNIGQGRFYQRWRKFADTYLAGLGSIYIIVAKKRVLPLTPIKPKWELRSKLTPINVSSMNAPQQKNNQQKK